MITSRRDLMTREAYNTTPHYCMYKIDNRLDPISMKPADFTNPAQKNQDIIDALNADPSVQGPVTMTTKGSRNYYFDKNGDKIKATKVSRAGQLEPNEGSLGFDYYDPTDMMDHKVYKKPLLEALYNEIKQAPVLFETIEEIPDKTFRIALQNLTFQDLLREANAKKSYSIVEMLLK